MSDLPCARQGQYVGRFAPSPSGPLHTGSLFTALASYLDARAHNGRWLLRIDDLDTPRNQRGAVDRILACLDACGLHWDGEVYYQSRHLDDYETRLQELTLNHQTYRCACSRKTLFDLRATPVLLNDSTGVYPGTCRNKTISDAVPCAIRVKTTDETICFQDALQGAIVCNLAECSGDFILKRKDGIFAYQLAVVVDDQNQKVNKIVRGNDLLWETPKQIYLQRLLKLPSLNYCHVPLIVDEEGFKLSKQTLAEAVNIDTPSWIIYQLLVLLKQQPPTDLKNASVQDLLNWAISHWRLDVLADYTEFQFQG